VAKHPKRFGAIATLPGKMMDGSLSEMEYALDTLKMDGVSTLTSVEDIYLGDSHFDPWFEEMHRCKVTLFMHPTVLCNPEERPFGVTSSSAKGCRLRACRVSRIRVDSKRGDREWPPQERA